MATFPALGWDGGFALNPARVCQPPSFVSTSSRVFDFVVRTACELGHAGFVIIVTAGERRRNYLPSLIT